MFTGYYDFDCDPPMPCLLINVINPSTHKSVEKVAMIDTGADFSVIPSSVVSQLGSLAYTLAQVRSFDGGIISVKLCKVSIRFGDYSHDNVEAVIMTDDDDDCIIGRDILSEYRLVLDAREGTVSLE